jgi:hypothetical protein
VVKSGGRTSRDGGRSGGGGPTININILIQNIVQQAVINAAKGAKVDVTQIAGQIVKASGNKISLTAAQNAVQRILLSLDTKANPDVIPKAMDDIVAATTTNPTIVNTIANIAGSQEAEDPAINGAIDDLTTDLANGKPAHVALTETPITDSASLGATGGTATGEGVAPLGEATTGEALDGASEAATSASPPPPGQTLATVPATTTGEEGAAPLGEEEGVGATAAALDEGTTEDDDEVASEEDDDSDTEEEEEEGVAEEEEEVSDDEDGGDDTEVSADDEGDDSDDGGGDDGDGGEDGGGDEG